MPVLEFDSDECRAARDHATEHDSSAQAGCSSDQADSMPSPRASRGVSRAAMLGHTIGILLAIAILFVVTSLKCSWEGKRQKIDRIIRSNAAGVREIVLLPLEHEYVAFKGYYPRQESLLRKPIAIRDRSTIDAFCKSLNTASRLLPNHPSTVWKVIVEIHDEKGTVSFVVYHTGQDENGTVVSIASHVTSGWNYGDWRCDALGPLLEKVAQQDEQ